MGSAKWVDTTVANNFKFLRQRYKDDQRVLGNMFGVSQSTISAYENGASAIPIPVLKGISKWYRVPVKDLLFTDLSSEIEGSQSICLDTIEHIGVKLFPIFTSDKAKCNSNFNCAYKALSSVLQLDNFEEFCKKTPTLTLAADLFECAWEETNAYVAIANHLSVVLLVYMIYCQPNVKVVQKILEGGKIDLLDLESKLHCDPRKQKGLPNEEKRKTFFEKHEKNVYEYIKLLKSSTRFSELGDYYLALYNLLAFTDDFSEREECSKAGAYMFGQLYMLDNKYVERIIDV